MKAFSTVVLLISFIISPVLSFKETFSHQPRKFSRILLHKRPLETSSIGKIAAFSAPVLSVQPLEYVNPKDAVLLNDASSSSSVKEGKEGLKDLIQKIETLKSDLEKDNQIEVADRVQKEFRLDVVRDTLNEFNGAFSEDTQRGTDRLIRLFLQDVTSLEKEGQVKTGRERSQIRTNNLIRTLDKAESTLKELQSFFP